jgi:protein involved in polysaccharide export with SLBB domain
MNRRFVVRLVLAAVIAASGFAAVNAQQSERFYVVGYVVSPGSYVLKANMTVGDAIDAAGGFAANRTATGIEIIRMIDGEKVTMGVTLAEPVLNNDIVSVK